MEPKKPSRPCEEIEKKANNDYTDEGEEEEIWEEVEADSEEVLKEDEDEGEEIVEEEDEVDPEIEEDPEEDPEEVTPVEEKKDTLRVDDHYYSVARECIIQRQSNQKEESEEREMKNSEESADCTPISASMSNFIIMPISKKRPTPERDSDSKEERESYSSMKKPKKGINDRSPSLAVSSAGRGRVWCHEDEITVLEGILEYKNKEGAYPPNDMVALHDFIKLKFLYDMSRKQMYEKVRRLKKKFLINLMRVENNVEPAFSKPHDYVLFNLSRKIWGDVNTSCRRGKSTDDNDDGRNRKSRKQPVIKGYNGSSSFMKEVKKEEVTMDDDSEGDFQLKYPFLSEALCKENWGSELADSVKRLLKEKLSSIGNAKAKVLEKKWKEIREQEREIFLQKMNLIALQTELMLKGSKNR